MADVLDLYSEPASAAAPVVCFDEKSVQLLADTHPPQPARPGQVARHGYQYERCGTANLFIVFQPGAGWRAVQVTAQRTHHDFAEQMQQLVDVPFPAAQRIRAVVDNLNTHTLAALYARFPAPEAWGLARKLAFHYTPVHGRGLNRVIATVWAEYREARGTGLLCGACSTDSARSPTTTLGGDLAYSPADRVHIRLVQMATQTSGESQTRALQAPAPKIERLTAAVELELKRGEPS